AQESTRLTLGVRSGLALLDFCGGQWARLDQQVEALTTDLAGQPRETAEAEVVAGCLALARGDLGRAEARLSAVTDRIEALGGFDLLPLPLSAWLRLMVARERLEEAAAGVEGLRAAVAQKGVWAPAVRALPA